MVLPLHRLLDHSWPPNICQLWWTPVSPHRHWCGPDHIKEAVTESDHLYSQNRWRQKECTNKQGQNRLNMSIPWQRTTLHQCHRNLLRDCHRVYGYAYISQFCWIWSCSEIGHCRASPQSIEQSHLCHHLCRGFPRWLGCAFLHSVWSPRCCSPRKPNGFR